MAHFMAVAKGNRGETSRLGSKASGLKVVANGWNDGVKVYATYNPDTNQDEFEIWLTRGSSTSEETVYIGTFSNLKKVKRL